jgi:hypothetical protein
MLHQRAAPSFDCNRLTFSIGWHGPESIFPAIRENQGDHMAARLSRVSRPANLLRTRTYERRDARVRRETALKGRFQARSRTWPVLYTPSRRCGFPRQAQDERSKGWTLRGPAGVPQRNESDLSHTKRLRRSPHEAAPRRSARHLKGITCDWSDFAFARQGARRPSFSVDGS